MSILDAAEQDSKAKKTPPQRVVPEDTQQTCIDLPGQMVRCTVVNPKLEIVLRKHRDVIFELQLFKGMTYTVEADQSDFYSARDKKLFEFRKKHKVSFKDGERLHLWVSREFKGSLILKANGKIMGKYQPNQLDPVRYDADPATKPAPLLVVMKNDESFVGTPMATSTKPAPDPWGMSLWNMSPVSSAMGLDSLTLYSRNQPSVPPAEQHPTVAVVDVDPNTMPPEIKKLIDYSGAGGGKSGLADFDPFGVATRNWIIGQVAGGGAYLVDNWKWLINSLNRQAGGDFRLVKAKIHYVYGKARIYFSGYSKTNPFFGAGGHGMQHTKIMQIFSGIGGGADAMKSSVKAVGATLKGNALISFVFGSALSIAEWKADLQKDGYDLAAALLTALIKAVLSAAIAALAVAFVLIILLVIFKVTIAVLVVGGLTLAASVVAAYAVDALDKVAGKRFIGESNEDGLAAGLAVGMRSAGQWLADAWAHLVERYPKDYFPLKGAQ